MDQKRKGFRGLIVNLATSGTFQDYEVKARNRIIFLNAVSYFGVIFMFFYSVVSFRSGNTALALSTLIGGTVVAIILLGMRWLRFFNLAGWLLTMCVAGLFGWLAWNGGEHGSGILWSFAFPLVSLFLVGTGAGSILTAVFGTFLALVLFLPQLNPAGFAASFSARVVGAYVYVYLFGLIYDLTRRQTETALETANIQLSKTTDELSFEKSQTDGILKNVNEGIFLLDKDLEIGGTHSSHLEDILERSDLAGQNLLSALKPILKDHDFHATADWLPMLFAAKVNPELLAEINPLSEVRATFFGQNGQERNKYLRFAFTPITIEGTSRIQLAVVHDATEEVLLQRKMEYEELNHQQAMEKLFQIVHVDPVLMAEFIRDTQTELEGINALLRDQKMPASLVIPRMYQGIHSIKGNALLLGLNELARSIHAMEDRIQSFLEKECTWKELLGLTLGLGTIQQEIEEIKALIQKVLSFQKAGENLGENNQGMLERALSDMVVQEAEQRGKSVRLVFSNFDSNVIPEPQRKLVKDVFVQLVRNSIAHGIESSDQRIQRGKSLPATITVSCQIEDGFNRFSCLDDGAGIDLSAIRKTILRQKLVDSETVKSIKPEDLVRFIFRTGFSTADVSDLSAGRGAGMALIKNRVEAAGGRVGVRSRAGESCEVTFRLPRVQEL